MTTNEQGMPSIDSSERALIEPQLNKQNPAARSNVSHLSRRLERLAEEPMPQICLMNIGCFHRQTALGTFWMTKVKPKEQGDQECAENKMALDWEYMIDHIVRNGRNGTIMQYVVRRYCYSAGADAIDANVNVPSNSVPRFWRNRRKRQA